jgi:Glycosyl transferases group 1
LAGGRWEDHLLSLPDGRFDTTFMKSAQRLRPVTLRPRALIVGSYRHPLGPPTDELSAAIGREADVVRVESAAPVRGALSVLSRASRAIREDGCELVHLLDPRFAVVGMMLQRQHGVPVSVSVSSADARSRSPLGRLAVRALNHLDQGFTAEASVAHLLRERAPRLPMSVVPPAASALPWPSKRGMASVSRALRGVRPGRLVLALPWPENRNDLRWFRDVVVPQLDARPLCLLLGAPSRRQARILLGAVGMQEDFRVHTGRVDGDVIASAARCVDAFVVCAASEPLPSAPASQLAIALATGGVPVVTNAAQDARVLAHERNGFVVEPADERTYVHTLNQLLSLPAVQRHFLGEEFARFTLAKWRWSDVASVYAERFAALVGRPQIPVDLRAA